MHDATLLNQKKGREPMTKERHGITWHGIQIEITYTPDTSPAFRRSYGRALDHLEIRSLVPAREPLPITETDEKLIASAAITGESSTPKTG